MPATLGDALDHDPVGVANVELDATASVPMAVARGKSVPNHFRSSEMYVFMFAAVNTSLTDHVRGVLQAI
jgi:hypothetical protein